MSGDLDTLIAAAARPALPGQPTTLCMEWFAAAPRIAAEVFALRVQGGTFARTVEEQRATIDETVALVTYWRSSYVDVCDAIAAETSGAADAVAKVRAMRATIERLEASVGIAHAMALKAERDDAIAALSTARQECTDWRHACHGLPNASPHTLRSSLREYEQILDKARTNLSTARRELAEAQAERDSYKRDLGAESAGGARLRRELGARESETFPAFVRRLAKERDAFKADLVSLYGTPAEARGGLTEEERPRVEKGLAKALEYMRDVRGLAGACLAIERVQFILDRPTPSHQTSGTGKRILCVGCGLDITDTDGTCFTVCTPCWDKEHPKAQTSGTGEGQAALVDRLCEIVDGAVTAHIRREASIPPRILITRLLAETSGTEVTETCGNHLRGCAKTFDDAVKAGGPGAYAAVADELRTRANVCDELHRRARGTGDGLTVGEALRLPEVRDGRSWLRVEAASGWLHFHRVTKDGRGDPCVETLQRHGYSDPWCQWGGNALSLIDLDAACYVIDVGDLDAPCTLVDAGQP